MFALLGRLALLFRQKEARLAAELQKFESIKSAGLQNKSTVGGSNGVKSFEELHIFHEARGLVSELWKATRSELSPETWFW